MKHFVAAVTFLAAVSPTVVANAQTASWNSTVEFDHGGQTAATMNGSGAGAEIVESHLGGYGGYNYDYAIWYDSSSWFNNGLSGGSELPYPSGVNSFDSGFALGMAADPTSSSPLFTLAFSQVPSVGNLYGISYVNYQTATNSGGNLDVNSGYGAVGTVSQGFYPAIAQASTNGHTYLIEAQNGEFEGDAPAIPTSGLAFNWGEVNSDGVSISWHNMSTSGTGWYGFVPAVVEN